MKHRRPPREVEDPDNTWNQQLMAACLLGKLSEVESLIARGADPVHTREATVFTPPGLKLSPLHAMLLQGEWNEKTVAVAELLLQYGASLDMNSAGAADETTVPIPCNTRVKSETCANAHNDMLHWDYYRRNMSNNSSSSSNNAGKCENRNIAEEAAAGLVLSMNTSRTYLSGVQDTSSCGAAIPRAMSLTTNAATAAAAHESMPNKSSYNHYTNMNTDTRMTTIQQNFCEPNDTALSESYDRGSLLHYVVAIRDHARLLQLLRLAGNKPHNSEAVPQSLLWEVERHVSNAHNNNSSTTSSGSINNTTDKKNGSNTSSSSIGMNYAAGTSDAPSHGVPLSAAPVIAGTASGVNNTGNTSHSNRTEETHHRSGAPSVMSTTPHTPQHVNALSSNPIAQNGVPYSLPPLASMSSVLTRYRLRTRSDVAMAVKPQPSRRGRRAAEAADAGGATRTPSSDTRKQSSSNNHKDSNSNDDGHARNDVDETQVTRGAGAGDDVSYKEVQFDLDARSTRDVLTPAELALRLGDTIAVRLLLFYGATLSLCSSKAINGVQSATARACALGDVAMVELLLDCGASLHQISEDGRYTLIHYAAAQPAVLDTLMRRSLSVDVPNAFGDSALVSLIRYGTGRNAETNNAATNSVPVSSSATPTTTTTAGNNNNNCNDNEVIDEKATGFLCVMRNSIRFPAPQPQLPTTQPNTGKNRNNNNNNNSSSGSNNNNDAAYAGTSGASSVTQLHVAFRPESNQASPQRGGNVSSTCAGYLEESGLLRRGIFGGAEMTSWWSFATATTAEMIHNLIDRGADPDGGLSPSQIASQATAGATQSAMPCSGNVTMSVFPTRHDCSASSNMRGSNHDLNTDNKKSDASRYSACSYRTTDSDAEEDEDEDEDEDEEDSTDDESACVESDDESVLLSASVPVLRLTPLMHAILGYHPELIYKLVREYRASVMATDAQGACALHYAALCRHRGVMDFFLSLAPKQAGAMSSMRSNASPPYTRGNNSWNSSGGGTTNSLHRNDFISASRVDGAEAGAAAGEVVNINATDAAGRTPLHYAAAINNTAVMESLWECGMLLRAGQPDKDGRTPLHAAVCADATAAVRLLLQHAAHVRTLRMSSPLSSERGLVNPVGHSSINCSGNNNNVTSVSNYYHSLINYNSVLPQQQQQSCCNFGAGITTTSVPTSCVPTSALASTSPLGRANRMSGSSHTRRSSSSMCSNNNNNNTNMMSAGEYILVDVEAVDRVERATALAMAVHRACSVELVRLLLNYTYPRNEKSSGIATIISSSSTHDSSVHTQDGGGGGGNNYYHNNSSMNHREDENSSAVDKSGNDSALEAHSAVPPPALLHRAVAKRLVGLVDLLLAHRADPNAVDAHDNTPLLCAVATAHVGSDQANASAWRQDTMAVARLLLRAGALPHAQSAHNLDTPIHHAARRVDGDGQLLHLLLHAAPRPDNFPGEDGEDMDHRKDDEREPDSSNVDDDTNAKRDRSALLGQRERTAQTLLDRTLLCRTDARGQTVLHLLCSHSDPVKQACVLPMLEEIIARELSYLRHARAAARGSPTALAKTTHASSSFTTAAGADTDAKEKTRANTKSAVLPVHPSSSSSCTRASSWVSSPMWTRTDAAGRTPLHLAALARFTDAMTVLLRYDPAAALAVDATGRTALHECARAESGSMLMHDFATSSSAAASSSSPESRRLLFSSSSVMRTAVRLLAHAVRSSLAAAGGGLPVRLRGVGSVQMGKGYPNSARISSLHNLPGSEVDANGSVVHSWEDYVALTDAMGCTAVLLAGQVGNVAVGQEVLRQLREDDANGRRVSCAVYVS